MEDLIIQKAIEIVKADFMQYPDYDEDLIFTLKDALTVLIGEHLEDEPSEEIYDFINQLF
jgi:hypothetical protein